MYVLLCASPQYTCRFTKRLLHPGANTADIITQYISSIKVQDIIFGGNPPLYNHGCAQLISRVCVCVFGGGDLKQTSDNSYVP